MVRLDRLHSTPASDVVSVLVYSAEAEDVDTVIIDGELVMSDGKLLTINEAETIATANVEAEKLMERAARFTQMKADLKKLCQLEGSDCGGRDRRPSWHWRALSILNWMAVFST